MLTKSDWLVSDETEENLPIPEQRLMARPQLNARPKYLPISSACSLRFMNSDRSPKLLLTYRKLSKLARERDAKNETVLDSVVEVTFYS